MTYVIVTATFVPLPGARNELIDALTRGIPAVHAEPGCELYAIHDADDGTIVMIEKWTTRTALDAHSTGSAVADLGDLIAPFLAEPVRVITMTALPAGDPDRGAL
ncbi:putative quinol monooxygenase [Microbacterium sp. SS28]|uniref:putative quinol monooxygenase n=1 Tax=Microbacterium sp. SS28 TaxID=2919948 RepID=UPI001FAA5FE5|nr:putative quinol monooxygenase [Microbacterium sp. SS28]